MSNLEISRTIALSTAHVEPDDIGQIAARGDHGDLVSYQKGDYGWFIWVNDEMTERTLIRNGFSDGFVQLYLFAMAQDCRWIDLDRDADTIDELPTFEW